MKAIITSSVTKKLISIVHRYKADVPNPQIDCWKGKRDGELWVSVLGQIAVVGSEASGKALKSLLKDKEDEWFLKLVSFTPKQRLKEIHHYLRLAGVRYVSNDITKCKKTVAAAYNFEVFVLHDGPIKYFSNLAAVPLESWRITVVADDLAYIKNKGSRDLLIGLGLVENAIAFDSRLIDVLKHLGAELPDYLVKNKPKYKALESELIVKICKPCGITGGHLDRILFNRKKEIVSNSAESCSSK